jgi:Zn ribbon nucleic-acid-binding protein
MTCECGENKWKIDMDLEYCIAILTCTKCGYSESLYLENNPEELKED